MLNSTFKFSALEFPTVVAPTFTWTSENSLITSLSDETSIFNSGPSPVVKPILSGLVFSSVTAIS